MPETVRICAPARMRAQGAREYRERGRECDGLTFELDGFESARERSADERRVLLDLVRLAAT